MTREQRFTFNEIGDRYDRYRPGYPELLFEDLLSLSGISPGERILEIGCGTGQATKVLAWRGFAMTCLEPGSQMASIARTNLEEFPSVEVRCTTFEAWPLEPAAFGLVFAAQAFHWVPPEIGFAKAAQALRPGGALAVFGNTEFIEHSHHGDAGGAVSEALDAAYSNHAPSLLGRPGSRWYAKEGPIPSLFADSGSFSPLAARRYLWSQRYTTSEYIGLLGTYSHHRLLPEKQREGLHGAIAEAVDGFGGEIEIFYEANLYLGQRTG
jgi:SAM-dependent methyltransferase